MKILLGVFNAKVERGNICKPTIWNDSLHQGINDNGFRIVNFSILKNLVFKSRIFPHQNIRKYNLDLS